jgi:hypothetical protein
MTTKQFERTIARIKDFHSKAENLINEIFTSHKVEEKTVAKKEAKASRKADKTTKVKTGAEKPRSGRDGGPNRSELIRAYFKKYGSNARPRDVIEALKKEGIEVAPALVSIVKNKLNGGATVTPKVDKTVVKKAERVAKSGDPLPAVVQSVLGKNKDGLKLADLTNRVEEAGYNYSGKKGHDGLKQNVYQCLYSLSKEKHHPGYEGTDPVVLHDETSKRYMLNPNAKRTA